jgi:hypothetical protein
MMTSETRRRLQLPALLALLLVGIWVGIGLVHEHTGAPTCQICNALQFSSADLAAPIVMAAPEPIALLTEPPTLPSAATPYLSTPPGRAPPLS